MTGREKEARLRIAQRAVAGAETLPIECRIQLFDDLSRHLLPRDQARVARETAWSLRQAMSQQADFMTLLNPETKP